MRKRAFPACFPAFARAPNRSGALQACQLTAVTPFATVASSPEAKPLVSIPMVTIRLQCYPLVSNRQVSIAIQTVAYHWNEAGPGPGKTVNESGGVFTTIQVTPHITWR